LPPPLSILPITSPWLNLKSRKTSFRWPPSPTNKNWIAKAVAKADVAPNHLDHKEASDPKELVLTEAPDSTKDSALDLEEALDPKKARIRIIASVTGTKTQSKHP
jgi:hypothetical protein